MAHRLYLLGRGTEGFPSHGDDDVGILVEELEDLLQAPQTALHALQNRLRHRVLTALQP